MPSVGDKIKHIAIPATGDQELGSADFAGRNLVLYFYPKDDTPGCTTESQGFRDHIKAFEKANTAVLGVSRDDLKSHAKFRTKYDLPFDLLADTEEQLCQYFDVIKEKNMYGKKYLGIERSTFLIDAQGVLRQEWRKVKVPGHVEEVLAAAQAL